MYNLLRCQRDYPDLATQVLVRYVQHEREPTSLMYLPASPFVILGLAPQEGRTRCHQCVAQGDDSLVYDQDQLQGPDFYIF
jgi:hypothetical protein